MTSTLSDLTTRNRGVWHHMTSHRKLPDSGPIKIVRGEGMHVWDDNGSRYLDATAGGVWCVNVGYGRREIADAMHKQLMELPYFAQTASTLPAEALSHRLLEKMPGLDHVYFSNSGSEANEKAFKMVRQIAAKKYGGEKHKILYRERDYHGSTIACLSATGQEQRRDHYGPFLPGFVEVPHCCEYRSQWGETADYGTRAANEIERVILEEGPDTVGALCLETITAGGGVIVPPHGYWSRVQEICTKYNVLLHLDEVVCGIGRTGAWFGYQHYDIRPDIVTMAKGLASGYAAISATVTTAEVFNAIHDDDVSESMDYFRDISTFGGCTAGPVAALVNMKIIEDEELIVNSEEAGERLLSGLKALESRHESIGDVRGKGLFIGVELVSNRATRAPAPESYAAAITAHCLNKGVMIGRTNRCFTKLNNTLCLTPALIAGEEEIDLVVSAIDSALAAVPYPQE